MMIRWHRLALFALLPLLVSCVGRTSSVETETTEGSTSSRSITLHGDSAEALVDQGKQHVLEGNYADPEAAFQAAYAKTGADPDHRAEALFELGEVYSNVLNPRRDHQKSLSYFAKLVEEFPESEFRERAEEYLQGHP